MSFMTLISNQINDAFSKVSDWPVRLTAAACSRSRWNENVASFSICRYTLYGFEVVCISTTTKKQPKPPKISNKNSSTLKSIFYIFYEFQFDRTCTSGIFLCHCIRNFIIIDELAVEVLWCLLDIPYHPSYAIFDYSVLKKNISFLSIAEECITDRCGRYPCRHGGKCLPSDQGAICLCPLGYGGDLCEMRLDLQVSLLTKALYYNIRAPDFKLNPIWCDKARK